MSRQLWRPAVQISLLGRCGPTQAYSRGLSILVGKRPLPNVHQQYHTYDRKSSILPCSGSIYRTSTQWHTGKPFSSSIAKHDGPTPPSEVPLRQPLKPGSIERHNDAQIKIHDQNSKATMAARLEQFTDQVLKTLNDISHRLNIYTGTDYTPISKLRATIAEQEVKVKTAHNAVIEGKTAHHRTTTIQAASQKEVVQLLERKHSWSAPDLERYMSLIRSEHVNEQAVTEAKQHLVDAERQLEQARQELEKMERRQYHEEQILSDTIRRNSTWITFALMGLNVVLLVGNFLIFEPLRRKKIVREMRAALDEKVLPSVRSHDGLQSANESANLVQPQEGRSVQSPRNSAETHTASAATAIPAAASHVQESSPALAVRAPESDVEAPSAHSHDPNIPTTDGPPSSFTTFDELAGRSATLITDLFSHREVSLRKVDLTSAIAEGFVAGTAGTLCILWLLGGIIRR